MTQALFHYPVQRHYQGFFRGQTCVWKVDIFLYGQDIDGNIVLLAFWWYSQVQDRSGGFGEMYKNVTIISRKMDLPALPQHAVQRWRHGIVQ